MQLLVCRMKGRSLLAAVISLVLVFILFAGVLLGTPAIVLAASAGGIKTTIASLVISLLLQCGVAPTNQTWLNNLNTAYGVTSTIGTIEDCISSGLLTQTADGLVDSGLSQAIASQSAYTDLGLNDLFEITADDALQVAGTTAASGAANLATQAIHVGTFGTIAAYGGAVVAGVGLGILAHHFLDWAGQKIQNHLGINQPPVPSDYAFAGGGMSSAIYPDNGRTWFYSFSPNARVAYGRYIDNKGNENYYIASAAPSDKSYSMNYSIGFDVTHREFPAGSTTSNLYLANNYRPFMPRNLGPTFDTREEAISYVRGTDTQPVETYVPRYSPDIMSPIGNQPYSNDDTGSVQIGEDWPVNTPISNHFPGVQNIIPVGSDMTPVDMDDYQIYVDTANTNTDNGITGEIQGDAFIDFVTPYIQQQTPDNPVNPDEPTQPETPTTNPWPVVDRPVTPEQPTIDAKPTITPEQQGEGLGLSTPDLRGIFPFCIPFDLYNLVRGLSASREAPSITVPVDLDGNTITVDLSPYNSAAQILRALELIAFVVGLAVATRKLIGA